MKNNKDFTDLTVHEFKDLILMNEKVLTKADVIFQFLELYNLYERVSSDRLNYINLWEKVPVEQRLDITKTLFDGGF